MSELVMDSAFFGHVLQDMGALIEKERDYLTGLDSDIGDGDHGINLSIGFR
ncbi:dihydroxyacetone kinase, partial [Listeria monocytogenes]|nr:dihydroxyacetone kinase [Listeria monocytogenes]